MDADPSRPPDAAKPSRAIGSQEAAPPCSATGPRRALNLFISLRRPSLLLVSPRLGEALCASPHMDGVGLDRLDGDVHRVHLAATAVAEPEAEAELEAEPMPALVTTYTP